MRIDRLTILVLFIGCKAAIPSSTGTYSENLSIHRPIAVSEISTTETETMPSEQIAYVPLEGHLKLELDSITKVAYNQNKEGRYVDGFVIQVYSGTSREEANNFRYQMNKLFPELSPKMSYHQPSFRVKGGRFIDRLEAHRTYRLVKEEFPRALLIPERFLLTYE